jgi:hypothetical protein
MPAEPDPQWLLRASAAVAGAALLLSPVVYPWYATHLLIFLCFAPNAGLLLLPCAGMAWFLGFWTPTAGTMWARLLSAVHQYYEPWRWVAYPPIYALLVWEWWRGPRTEDRRQRDGVAVDVGPQSSVLGPRS